MYIRTSIQELEGEVQEKRVKKTYNKISEVQGRMGEEIHPEVRRVERGKDIKGARLEDVF